MNETVLFNYKKRWRSGRIFSQKWKRGDAPLDDSEMEKQFNTQTRVSEMHSTFEGVFAGLQQVQTL